MPRTPGSRCPTATKALGSRHQRALPCAVLLCCLVVSKLLLLSSASSSLSSGGGYAGSAVTPPPRILNKNIYESSTKNAPWEQARDATEEHRKLDGAPLLGVNANEFIDEHMAQVQQGTNTGGSKEDDGVYYRSTEVFHHNNNNNNKLVLRNRHSSNKWKRNKRSLLRAEGDHLLHSLGKLGTHTTHGVCRAVNVTGNAAAVVAGGVFKLAGAAILDGVDGMEYASSRSPTEVPGVTDVYRFLTKGLRKTGKAVYDLGVAAENMTAEATEAAEETLRYVVESVVETAADFRPSDDPGKMSREAIANGYFSAEEARIVDNIMLDIPMSSPDPYLGDDNGGTSEGIIPTAMSPSNSSVVVTDGTTSLARGTEGVVGSVDPAAPRALSPSLGSGFTHPGAGIWKPKASKTTFPERARRAIRRSIMRSNKKVPSMRFPQMVACGFVFACRALTKNPLCGAASFVGARMYLKFVEPIYLECLKEQMMSDIKFEAVARLHEGSPERARWFNTAVGAMWVPMLEPLLSGWVARQITAGIERSLPSNVSWVGLGKITLGPTPPKVRYVRAQNVTSLAARTSMGQSNAVIDSILLEAGQPGGEVKGENVVYLEMGVDWTSTRSKISLKLGDQARRRRWWSIRSYVPTYRVKLTDFGVQAKVVLALAIGEGRPYVKRLWLCFSEPPKTHLSLEALHGMDLANLPVLRKHLRHLVLRLILPITEPKHLAVEMKPPPPPQSINRRAARAARVLPTASVARRGAFSRVPLFGLRTLLANRGAGQAASRAQQGVGGLDIDGEEYGPARQALEEATKRLLVEVGGNREETVMAAVHQAAYRDNEDGDSEEAEAVPHVPQVTMIEASASSRSEAASPLERQGQRREGHEARKWYDETETSKEVNEGDTAAHSAQPETGSSSEPESARAGGSMRPAAAETDVGEGKASPHDEEEGHAEDPGVKLTPGERRRAAVRSQRDEIRRQRAARVERAERAARAERAEPEEKQSLGVEESSAMQMISKRRGTDPGKWGRWWVRFRARARGKNGRRSPEHEEMVKKVLALSRCPNCCDDQ